MADLKTLRKRLGLSQAEIAERLGVDQATISRIEAGKARPSGPVQILIDMMAANPPAAPVPQPGAEAA